MTRHAEAALRRRYGRHYRRRPQQRRLVRRWRAALCGRAAIQIAGDPVVIWQDEGRGKRAEAPLSQNTIMQLLPCGDGIAAVAADPAFGLIAADGEKRVWQEGVIRRHARQDARRLHPRRGRQACPLRPGLGAEEPVLFDLAAFRLADAPEPLQASRRPKPPALPSAIGRTTTAEAERQAHRA